MMNGSRVLEGYVPDYDATVVTRLLDAGLDAFLSFFLIYNLNITAIFKHGFEERKG